MKKGALDHLGVRPVTRTVVEAEVQPGPGGRPVEVMVKKKKTFNVAHSNLLDRDEVLQIPEDTVWTEMSDGVWTACVAGRRFVIDDGLREHCGIEIVREPYNGPREAKLKVEDDSKQDKKLAEGSKSKSGTSGAKNADKLGA